MSEKRGEEEVKMCDCGVNAASKPHPCPYQEEIHGDGKTLCTCCDECMTQCAMEI